MNVTETYPLAVAAKAAGTTKKKVRSRIDHGSIELRGCDRKSSGSGNWVGLSRNRIVEIATVEVMTSSGISVSYAADWAKEFSDTGNHGRAPGELYPCGKTILVVTTDGAFVRNVFHDALLTDLMTSACTTIVDLNRIVDQVDSILNDESNK
jgi:hypothetical protein